MDLRNLLEKLAQGKIPIPEAEEIIRQGTVSLNCARLDMDREHRQGMAEVIFCEGKTAAQTAEIFQTLSRHHQNVFGTRANAEQAEATQKLVPDAVYLPTGRILKLHRDPTIQGRGRIIIVSAGTADLPVVEEAAETSRILGNETEVILDVGVAGVHRVLSVKGRLDEAVAVIVVAGMDGALPSVVGGLTRAPVIAVPTSVGYGAAFGGLSALLTMLTSCAAGVTVVNIDNGFGAAVAATRINRP